MEILARKSYFRLFVFFCLLIVCMSANMKHQDDTNQHIQSQESSHIVRKRPTVLLNRLMSALQTMLRQPQPPPVEEEVVSTHFRQPQELERRGYPKHYWKCYFNAVSCFRRKRTEGHSTIHSI